MFSLRIISNIFHIENSCYLYSNAHSKLTPNTPSFGMVMPGRSFNGGDYRYGFNGKENDDEVKGTGNLQDYGMRIYDGRIGKFLSVDPLQKEYPWLTPFAFAGNTPIQAVDLDGLETQHYLLVIEKGKPKLKYLGEQTREFDWYEQYDDSHPAANFKNAQGDLITDKTIVVWDLRTRMEISDPEVFGEYVPKVTFKYYKQLMEWSKKGYLVDVVEYENLPLSQEEAESIGDGLALALMLQQLQAQMDYAVDGTADEVTLTKTPDVNKSQLQSNKGVSAAGKSKAREILQKGLDKAGKWSKNGKNYKAQWSEAGYDYEVRIHEPQSIAPEGSNSKKFSTFRVARRLQGVDKNGQGNGWEYMDSKGDWHKTSDLKSGKMEEAANDTHIPL